MMTDSILEKRTNNVISRVGLVLLISSVVFGFLFIYFLYVHPTVNHDHSFNDVFLFYLHALLPDAVSAGIIAVFLAIFAGALVGPIRALVDSSKSHRQDWSNTFIVKSALTHHCTRQGSELDYVYYFDGREDSYVNPNLTVRLRGHLKKAGIKGGEYVERWENLAKRAEPIFASMRGDASAISQGALNKLSLDLDVGGAFFYAFDDDNVEDKPGSTGVRHFLFAVTVSQIAMDRGWAYSQMQSLYEELVQIRATNRVTSVNG